MTTPQTPTPPLTPETLNEPVRWSDWLDFLGRLENEFARRETFWRETRDDSHGIATVMMVASADVRSSLAIVIAEVVARKSNVELTHRR